jgi:hypothetical protein
MTAAEWREASIRYGSSHIPGAPNPGSTCPVDPKEMARFIEKHYGPRQNMPEKKSHVEID